jgi:hypothetical protein
LKVEHLNKGGKMQEEIYNALIKKYEAEQQEAKVNIELYFRNPVAVADHPNLIETIDGLVKDYNKATERLEGLQKLWRDRDGTID